MGYNYWVATSQIRYKSIQQACNNVTLSLLMVFKVGNDLILASQLNVSKGVESRYMSTNAISGYKTGGEFKKQNTELNIKYITQAGYISATIQKSILSRDQDGVRSGK